MITQVTTSSSPLPSPFPLLALKVVVPPLHGSANDSSMKSTFTYKPLKLSETSCRASLGDDPQLGPNIPTTPPATPMNATTTSTAVGCRGTASAGGSPNGSATSSPARSTSSVLATPLRTARAARSAWRRLRSSSRIGIDDAADDCDVNTDKNGDSSAGNLPASEDSAATVIPAAAATADADGESAIAEEREGDSAMVAPPETVEAAVATDVGGSKAGTEEHEGSGVEMGAGAGTSAARSVFGSNNGIVLKHNGTKTVNQDTYDKYFGAGDTRGAAARQRRRSKSLAAKNNGKSRRTSKGGLKLAAVKVRVSAVALAGTTGADAERTRKMSCSQPKISEEEETPASHEDANGSGIDVMDDEDFLMSPTTLQDMPMGRKKMLVSRGVVMSNAEVVGADLLLVEGQFEGVADVTHLQVERG